MTASRVMRGLLLHLIIQVSDDLQVQCKTYRPTLLLYICHYGPGWQQKVVPDTY